MAAHRHSVSERNVYAGRTGLAGEEFDVEYVHALILPWWGVLTSAGAGSAQVEDGETVAHHGIQSACKQDRVLK